LFCDRPKDRDDRILEDSTRVEVWFREGSEANAVAAEPVEVLQGFKCALSRQPVECPKHYNIKAPFGGVGHHGLKLSPIGFAARIVIFVLNNDPALGLAKFFQLVGLVSGLLTFVLG
jgi:hypothetical protein